MAMQAQQLAHLLAREGVCVERLATNGPYRPAFVRAIPVLRALCRLLPYLFAVWRLAGRTNVIHLMANSGWSWQLYSAPVLWFGWLRGTPVIVNYRGGEAESYFRRSFNRVKPSLRKAAAVVVPSEFLQAIFSGYGEDAQVIPNIIDREIFKPCNNTDHPRGPYFTLVIARNLEPIYGIDSAIRAFAQAFQQDSSLRLRIAGSGPAYNALTGLAKALGVGQAVYFEGRLDRQGIVDLYAAADAMVNPSTVDNMPNSVIEALACGLPVISTNVGGVPFIVRQGETALLVPVNDDSALASAMLQMKNDENLRARLRRNGLAQVEQYTWATVRHQWLDLYASLYAYKRRVVL